MRVLSLLGVIACALQVKAQSTFEPVRAPSVPLAVRSPYLNAWLNGPRNESKGYLAGQWPQFWTGSTLGWQGFVKVDGENFNWMGGHPGAPNVEQVSIEYTSTKTIFTMRAGNKIEMRVEFLSPIYPEDIRRQSMTSSYLQVSVKCLDGNTHNVQVYADVSGQWASGDPSTGLEWTNGTQNGVVFHKFWRADQLEFEEAAEQAAWGNWYWATTQKPGLTHQSGSDFDVRGTFLNNGSLTGTIDTNFRPINRNWPVFGLAHDLPAVDEEWQDCLFTIGYTHDAAVQFQGRSAQPQRLESYWKIFHPESDIVSIFIEDWEVARNASDGIDARVSRESNITAGRDYLTIASLSVRQTFGALVFTNLGTTIAAWQKEISSGSFIQTADVLFPTWPFMVYFNPELIRWTLAPLIENQEAGQYPKNSSIHDLGRFPKALGYPDGNDWPMPLEESANMIIMMLSYVQRTRDTGYLFQHRGILERWGQFLISETRIPSDQLSTDDFAGNAANQTNLAIKGIIALRAMEEIKMLLGARDQEEEYRNRAAEYLEYWMAHSINQNLDVAHAMFQYDVGDSYGVLYNLYADVALGLNFVPREVYEVQDKFYPTVATQYGVVLDTRGSWTKLDWELFTAAVSSTSTRDMFIRSVARWIGQTPSDRALTDLYDVNTGDFASVRRFTARPVVGGSFALMIV